MCRAREPGPRDLRPAGSSIGPHGAGVRELCVAVGRYRRKVGMVLEQP